MQKFVKQVMVVSAVVGMGVSVCTTLANAKDTQAEVTLSAGKDIEIITAPTITFKEAKLTGASQTIESESMGDPLKVVNPGQNTEWHVQASMTKLVGKTSSSTLAGAKLTWHPGKISTQSDTDKLPTINNGIVLNNKPTPIMDATPDKGVGTFSVDPGTATLDIAGNAVEDKYSATITWTLVNGSTGTPTP